VNKNEKILLKSILNTIKKVNLLKKINKTFNTKFKSFNEIDNDTQNLPLDFLVNYRTSKNQPIFTKEEIVYVLKKTKNKRPFMSILKNNTFIKFSSQELFDLLKNIDPNTTDFTNHTIFHTILLFNKERNINFSREQLMEIAKRSNFNIKDSWNQQNALSLALSNNKSQNLNFEPEDFSYFIHNTSFDAIPKKSILNTFLKNQKKENIQLKHEDLLFITKIFCYEKPLRDNENPLILAIQHNPDLPETAWQELFENFTTHEDLQKIATAIIRSLDAHNNNLTKEQIMYIFTNPYIKENLFELTEDYKAIEEYMKINNNFYLINNLMKDPNHQPKQLKV
jgi:hypothetical protein